MGRFAPSPTGRLHLGSLFTALGSFLEARTRKGRWLLRIDDLDTPRNVPGVTEAILRTLDAFGLHWDEPIAYQSQHQQAYQQALTNLQQLQLLYYCTCSRRSLSDVSPDALGSERVYPQFCRNQYHLPGGQAAVRIKTESVMITFNDVLQGTITENLATQHGDFILQRKDRIIAYQLAVVLDDYVQGVNQVVRGSDLLASTIKQIYLHQCLKLPIPSYCHMPVITGAQGLKLSKRDFAPAVNHQNRQQILFKLLELLQQNPPSVLRNEPVAVQLDWALKHWNPNALNHVRSIEVTDNSFFHT